MKKWISEVSIILILVCIIAGCTKPETELDKFQNYGEERIRFHTREEYEKEFLKYVAGKDVDERIEVVAGYMPKEYYLMPEGDFRMIEIYYDVMSVCAEDEHSWRELYWNLKEAKKELNNRIASMGGFNTRYTPEDDVRSYEFTKVTVDGIEYIIERGFSSPKAIAYRESVGEPLTEEEIMYPREMTIYWEQDGAFVKVYADENIKITDDAELVSHYGKLQKVYYNTNDAAQGA